MMRSERIVSRTGVELAIILYRWRPDPGIQFVTESDNQMQVGCMRREKGYVVPPHEHRIVERTVSETPEVLFVRSGELLLDIYEPGDLSRPIRSQRLEAGDVVVLLRGGHGVTFLEESDVQEVRQGPYYGEAYDKIREPHSAMCSCADCRANRTLGGFQSR